MSSSRGARRRGPSALLASARCARVLAALLLVATGPARAQDARTEAQRKMVEGKALFDQGKPEEALRAFEAAYELSPNPRWLYTIGVAYQTVGRDVEAMTSYELFLRQAQDVSPAHRADAEAQAATLRGKLAQVELRCPEGDAVVSVDGRPRARTPLAAPLWLAPGERRIGVEKAGFEPAQRVVTLAGGQATVVEVDLRRRPVLPSPRRLEASLVDADADMAARPQPRPVYKRWWFWAGVGGLVVAGVVTGVALGSGKDRLPCPPGYCD